MAELRQDLIHVLDDGARAAGPAERILAIALRLADLAARGLQLEPVGPAHIDDQDVRHARLEAEPAQDLAAHLAAAAGRKMAPPGQPAEREIEQLADCPLQRLLRRAPPHVTRPSC